jgi:surfeit locus 1 family protein
VKQPIVTFGLGTWQIKRLQWKVNLIEELDEKLSKPSMRLPAKIEYAFRDNSATVDEDVADLDLKHGCDTRGPPTTKGHRGARLTSLYYQFAYRKVEVTGQYDHSKEMLLGPRTREGVLGYSVVTPLIRDDGDASNAILVNRGHVSRTMKDRAARPESQVGLSIVQSVRPTELLDDPQVEGSQTIVGMLRDQDKRNMFTPPNSPEKGEYQFADIAQMASQCGTQPVLIDEVFGKSRFRSWVLERVLNFNDRGQRRRDEIHDQSRNTIRASTHDRAAQHACNVRNHLVSIVLLATFASV